ncbi:MAG: anti-sigma F factor [Dethiobacter sp.]|jgi:stage II sporulation protein AB (anti-sigma F factor)|nr:anti-sigma F factor [Dethiobacter sp.]
MIKAQSYMQLEIPSLSENESFARVVVAAFASRLDPTLEELSDIKTAVSEAVTNAIIHAYEDRVGLITVSALIEDNTLTITIADQGVGIANPEQARQPLYTSKQELERSGMGFTIMENFMDSMAVHTKPGEGTAVILTKQIRSGSNLREN